MVEVFHNFNGLLHVTEGTALCDGWTSGKTGYMECHGKNSPKNTVGNKE